MASVLSLRTKEDVESTNTQTQSVRRSAALAGAAGKRSGSPTKSKGPATIEFDPDLPLENLDVCTYLEGDEKDQ